MYKDIMTFWFKEVEPAQWFKKDLVFDQMIHNRFSETHQKARAGELFSWRETPEGALAEIIVLDQFSRNIYRDNAAAFACDAMALALAQEAVSKGFDGQLVDFQRTFLYMPFMHSESKLIHLEAVKLFESLGNQTTLEFEHKHKEIIDRFGRYPHRNTLLGRSSTEEELLFLQQPDSSF